MSKYSPDKEIKVLGIDLAKQSFQLHGVNDKGEVVCGGAHDMARKFKELGHDVRLMAPQFVKPYVKSNKNDAADAEAVCIWRIAEEIILQPWHWPTRTSGRHGRCL